MSSVNPHQEWDHPDNDRARPVIIDAVVPVKGSSSGKTRLAEWFTPAERVALTRAMLRDIVAALLASRLFRTVAVISPDGAMLALARELGATAIAEPAAVGGLNGALSIAVARLAAEGAQAVLIVQGDVPLIGQREITQLVRPPLTPPLVRAAPTQDGGTSALLLAPPAVIPLAFGQNSFARHQRNAHAAGASFAICASAALSWDVDRPEDIARLLDQPRQGEAVRVALELNTARRACAAGGGHS